MKKMLFLMLSLIISIPHITHSTDKTAVSLAIVAVVGIGSYATYKWCNPSTSDAAEDTTNHTAIQPANEAPPSAKQQYSQDKDNKENETNDSDELNNQQLHKLQQQKNKDEAERVAQQLLNQQQSPVLTETLQNQTQNKPNNLEQVQADKAKRISHLSSPLLKIVDKNIWNS